MSGFEIVGVILGVYPMITAGLKVYQASKTARRGAASLALALNTEEIIFTEFVQNLLAPNVSEADLVRLTDPSSQSIELWKDTTLHQNLRNRLGSKKAEVVLDTLQEIRELLSSLQDELSRKDHGMVRDLMRGPKWLLTAPY